MVIYESHHRNVPFSPIFPVTDNFALSFPGKIAHDLLEYEDRLKVESKVREKIVFFLNGQYFQIRRTAQTVAYCEFKNSMANMTNIGNIIHSPYC